MTKEEYASKLHLLQQEYDELREKCEQLEIDLEKKTQHSQQWCDKAMEAAGQRLAIQQEYDKLKRKNEMQEAAIELLLEKFAALKEKADKMVEALNTILNTNYDNHERVILKVKAIADEALSSYNTNNQNENDG